MIRWTNDWPTTLLMSDPVWIWWHFCLIANHSGCSRVTVSGRTQQSMPKFTIGFSNSFAPYLNNPWHSSTGTLCVANNLTPIGEPNCSELNGLGCCPQTSWLPQSIELSNFLSLVDGDSALNQEILKISQKPKAIFLLIHQKSPLHSWSYNYLP